MLIAARGTSDHAAVYGKYLIEILTGLPVSLAAPSVFTVYKKTLKLRNSLVIGISQSGKDLDVLEVIKAAKEEGAITVSITNFEDSALAREAKYHLFCACGEENSVAATKTFSSQMFLLANLTALWSGDAKLTAALLELPLKIEETFKVAEEIQVKIGRYRFMNECFILARGINYAIALEASLKIQETSYVRASAYATSDFHHGPYAMIHKNMPVFIFAPKGETLEEVWEMVLKLKEEEADITIISDVDELLEMGSCAFKIPPCDNDFISPFINVVVAQMLACKLSVEKGLDPDSPRGLKKVTLTK